jgi:diaminohydroxyphosphoribosylaminopyrimidine deaminase/5-amino-6-(5-phosphoribosylamino)uracil reductase
MFLFFIKTNLRSGCGGFFFFMDKQYMKMAIDLAKNGAGKVEPNPMVGCVIVNDGKIVSKGWHHYFGAEHAEIDALSKAGKKAENADLYVTLEPCNSYGKKPPCSHSILKAKIRRVFYAVKDPNESGSETFLKNHNIEVYGGLLKKEASFLIKEHLKHIKIKNRVSIKAAMTLDGKIASHIYDSKWITSKKARDFVHKLRSGYDAVLIGTNTALKDNPFLTSHLKGRNPIRVVIDANLRIPQNANILNNESSTIIFYDKSVQKMKEHFYRDNIILAPIDIKKAKRDFNIIIEKLNLFAVKTILIEGGGQTIASALFSKSVDDIYFFIAPKIIGGQNAVSVVGGVGIEKIKNALMIKDASVKKIGRDFLFKGRIK